MLEHHKGILLHHFPYSESSAIVKILTEAYGIRSYIIRGIHSKKGKKTSLLQPLSLIRFSSRPRQGKRLHTLREPEWDSPFHTIPYDIRKTTMALFMGEFLYRSLQEEDPDPELFTFIRNAVQVLDLEEAPPDLHILFVARLTLFFGIAPSLDEEGTWFDLHEGRFLSYRPSHELFLDPTAAGYLQELLKRDLGLPEKDQTQLPPAAVRKEVLDKMVQYFRLHLEGMGDLRSHKVLSEVFG